MERVIIPFIFQSPYPASMATRMNEAAGLTGCGGSNWRKSEAVRRTSRGRWFPAPRCRNIAITAAAGTEVAGIRTSIAPDAARERHNTNILLWLYDVGSIGTATRCGQAHTLDTVMDISVPGDRESRSCCMGMSGFQRAA